MFETFKARRKAKKEVARLINNVLPHINNIMENDIALGVIEAFESFKDLSVEEIQQTVIDSLAKFIHEESMEDLEEGE